MKPWAILTVILGLIVTTLHADDTAVDVAKLQAELEALRRQNAALQQELAQLKADQPAPVQSRSAVMPPPPTEDALVQENLQLKRRLEAAESAKQDLQSERTRLEQLAGMTAKGDLVESRVAMITTTYDDAADRTTIASVPELIQGPGGLSLIEHRMTLAFSFSGKAVAQPVDHFDFDLFTRDNSDDRYKNLKAVTFVIDGESIVVPVAAYEVLDTQSRQAGTRQNSPRKPNKSFSERLRLALDCATVNRISHANDVKLQLYNSTFALTRENIATFVALRERHDLGK